VCVCVVEGR